MTLLKQLFEAAMKRSDPYISGELEGPRPAGIPAPAKAVVKPIGKKSSFDTKILNMAEKAGVQPREVEQIWDKHKSQVDISRLGAYGIITSRVKKELGI